MYIDHQTIIKYGAFFIKAQQANWNGDTSVQVQMEYSDSKHCLMEGVWSPDKTAKNDYTTALAGVCIWNKYDFLFSFKPRSKGNPGAVRSMGSPRDTENLFDRLKNGHLVEKVVISANPLGAYQTRTIGWQSDVVRRLKIKELYYVLPIEEYRQTLNLLRNHLQDEFVDRLDAVLQDHHDQLEQYIRQHIKADIEFIYPLREKKAVTADEAYVWPYKNLQFDLSIEEMEEVRIPYQVHKEGFPISPVLLGMLDNPCPYYERRIFSDASQQITMFPIQ